MCFHLNKYSLNTFATLNLLLLFMLCVVQKMLWSQDCMNWAQFCRKASWVHSLLWCWWNRKVMEANNRAQRDFARCSCPCMIMRGHADPLSPSNVFKVQMSTPPTHSFLFPLISCHLLSTGGEFLPSPSPLPFTLRVSICKHTNTCESVIIHTHSQTSQNQIKIINICSGRYLFRSPNECKEEEKKRIKILCSSLWAVKN